MVSSSERPLDHRYRNEHPVRTLGYLFRADRRHLIAAVGVLVLTGAALVACATPTHGSSSTGCRTARTPWSASAAPASRAGSAWGCPQALEAPGEAGRRPRPDHGSQALRGGGAYTQLHGGRVA
ncbi:hypothetical protein [Streptomyces sp. NPDC001492]